MPSAQVINLNPPPRTEETTLEKTLGAFTDKYTANRERKKESDALKAIYEQHKDDGENLFNTIKDVETSVDIGPTARVNTVKQLMEMQKYNFQLQKKAAQDLEKAERKSGKKELSPDERQARKDRLIAQGFPEDEADEFIDASPGVQQTIWRNHNEEKARKIRQNQVKGQPKSTDNGIIGTGQTVPEGELGVENSLSNEAEPIDEDAWPDIPAPVKMTPSEEVKWGNQNQKENNKLLGETRQKTTANRGIGIRLNRLASLSDKVPDDIGRLVVNPETGEPYPAATLLKLGVNKETQDYVKTLNDFLIDAKAYFGNRVTNFDVQAFKSRLPTLLNTADGRRLIIKQMQLMNDLESLHGTTLEDGLKAYGRDASYSDILSVADQKVAGREKVIIQKINDLDTASNYMDQMAKNPGKFKDTVLMQDPKGTFKAMPKDKVNTATSRGWEIY